MIELARAQERAALYREFDRLRRDLDASDRMARMEHYRRQALEMVLSGKARQAFRLDQEPDRVRETYGRNSFGEKMLLARRLVEAGVTFVTLSPIFGYFDNHGDDVVWGGLIKGLKPLLPRLDQALYALVTDLEARGLLDDTLVLALGEFGRSPIFSQRGTGGRGHWSNCMSMLVAGGGLPWRYNGDGSVAVASPKKDVRVFNGREYALEEGIVCDFALVRASLGDRHGNLVFHKATRQFNPLCAMAGKITIAEVEELVEPGEIDPEQVHLPGIYVQRVVAVGPAGKRIERVTTRKRDGGR